MCTYENCLMEWMPLLNQAVLAMRRIRDGKRINFSFCQVIGKSRHVFTSFFSQLGLLRLTVAGDRLMIGRCENESERQNRQSGKGLLRANLLTLVLHYHSVTLLSVSVSLSLSLLFTQSAISALFYVVFLVQDLAQQTPVIVIPNCSSSGSQ